MPRKGPMPSRETILGYVDQMAALEKKMEEYYRDLSERVENPEYRKIFTEMSTEEAVHAGLVEELMELLGRELA